MENGTKIIDTQGNTWIVVGVYAQEVELSRLTIIKNGETMAYGRFTFTANREMLEAWIGAGQACPRSA